MLGDFWCQLLLCLQHECMHACVCVWFYLMAHKHLGYISKDFIYIYTHTHTHICIYKEQNGLEINFLHLYYAKRQWESCVFSLSFWSNILRLLPRENKLHKLALFTSLLHVILTKCGKIINKKVRRNFKNKTFQFLHMDNAAQLMGVGIHSPVLLSCVWSAVSLPLILWKSVSPKANGVSKAR
jgi:hypothetical protein